MSAGVKVVVIGAFGSMLFGPLALIGLLVMVQQGTAQSCASPPSSVVNAGTADSPTATGPPTSPPSAATTTAVSLPMASCDAGDGRPDSGATGIPDGFVLPSNTQQAITVAFALAQLGKPYVFGATGPDSYDCSGLVMTAWSRAGVSIPRVTGDQAQAGVAVSSLAAMQPGDLIFIPGSDGTMARPGHVGMYIGDIGGYQYLVQAPHTGTVVKTSLVSAWASEVAAIRRPLGR